MAIPHVKDSMTEAPTRKEIADAIGTHMGRALHPLLLMWAVNQLCGQVMVAYTVWNWLALHIIVATVRGVAKCARPEHEGPVRGGFVRGSVGDRV